MVTTAVAPAPGEQEPAKISAMGRIIGVLFSPGATFEDIVRKPSWILPLAILTVFSIGVVALLVQKVDWASMIRKQQDGNPRMAQMTDEQKENAVTLGVKIAVPVTWAAGVVGAAISALLFAVIYMLAFNVFKGAGVKFGTSFAIVCYALVPSIIASILAIIVLYFKKVGDVDPQRMAATNVAAFLAADAPKWLVALGTSIDIFWIWTMALFAIGFAAANPRKITKGSAFAIVIGLWLVWVLGKVGWAAM
jgi:hypothetical protein